MKTIDTCNIDFRTEYFPTKFKYQLKLTPLLDNYNQDFDQEIINQIVLWKVNRYAEIPGFILAKINKINKESDTLDINLTHEIIEELLKSENNGFGLPMISTILRFKNPSVYQIIDQRVYRFIYGKDLHLKRACTEKERLNQIKIYIDYLADLRLKCTNVGITFTDANRILYMADKDLNKDVPLKNYGTNIK